MIEIIDSQHKFRINRKRFKGLLKKMVKHFKLEEKDPEVVLAFVGTKKIADLNRTFLGEDASTDVLSFPIGEEGADGKYYLGDIIISVPQALKQCSSKGHSLDRELELLSVHGFLHLLGFDHGEGIEKEEENIRNLLLER